MHTSTPKYTHSRKELRFEFNINCDGSLQSLHTEVLTWQLRWWELKDWKFVLGQCRVLFCNLVRDAQTS